MYYEEMEVGQRFYCEPILISAEEIERFAVSYDPLPIHIDPEVANTTIFEGYCLRIPYIKCHMGTMDSTRYFQ